MNIDFGQIVVGVIVIIISGILKCIGQILLKKLSYYSRAAVKAIRAWFKKHSSLRSTRNRQQAEQITVSSLKKDK